MRKLFFSLCVYFVSLLSVFGQTDIVTGTVTSDEDGSPLPGVTVSIKGTQQGTTTDFDGNFSISVSQGSVLVFSYIGMETKEVNVTSSSLNVTLESDTKVLSEVVVTGYKTMDKEAFTGAAVTVSEEILESAPNTNLSNTLSGAVSGLDIATNTSDIEGNIAGATIRGKGSINLKSDPLYVVDGVTVGRNADFLSSYSADDIENITVLKDAASTAIYGSRGSNGVIVITTKKGRPGKIETQVNVEFGYNYRKDPDVKYLGIKDYYEYSWETVFDALNSSDFNPIIPTTGLPLFTKEQVGANTSSLLVTFLGGWNLFDVPNDSLVLSNGTFNPNAKQIYFPDWEDYHSKDGHVITTDISLRGGTEKANFYLSLRNNNTEGIRDNSKLVKYSLLFNFQSQLTDWLKLGFKSHIIHSDYDGPYFPTQTYTEIPPIYPLWVPDDQNPGEYLKDEDGNLIPIVNTGNYTYRGIPLSLSGRLGVLLDFAGIPLVDMMLNKLVDNQSNERIRSIANTTLYFDIKFLQNFTFTNRFTLNKTHTRELSFANVKGKDPRLSSEARDGVSVKKSSEYRYWKWDKMLVYNRVIKNHRINALFVHESQEEIFDNIGVINVDFPIASQRQPDAGINEDPKLNSGADNTGTFSKSTLESYLFNVDYNYDNKYYFETSFRRDGSSSFQEGHRWGTFWSVAGGWRLSNEKFLEKYNWLDNLYLKIGYGVTGDNNVIGGSTDNLYNQTTSNYNQTAFSLASSLNAIEQSWEEDQNINIGINIGLFNRVKLDLNFYRSLKEDLITSQNIPRAVGGGVTSIRKNFGSLENKGFEIQLFVDILKKNDFKWSFSINGSHNINKIKELAGDIPNLSINLYRVPGGSVYNQGLYKFAGVNPNTGIPQYYKKIRAIDPTTGENLRDENGLSVFTGELEIVDGQNDPDIEAFAFAYDDWEPELYGGFTHNFSYKGLNLGLDFSYGIGGKSLPGFYYISAMNQLFGGGIFGLGVNYHEDLHRRWRKPGDITNISKAQGANENDQNSDRFRTSDTYLKLKTISLSYNLPKKWVSNYVNNVQLYLRLYNVARWTRSDGVNPEGGLVGTGGQFSGQEPLSEIGTFVAGLTVKF